MANKSVKFNIPTMPKVSVKEGINTVKKTAGEINEYMIETSDELVNRGIKRGSQWQDVSAKAIQGGLKLAANQQEIIFDALETVKAQVTKRSRKRMAEFFSRN